jgi:beta-glucosidase
MRQSKKWAIFITITISFLGCEMDVAHETVEAEQYIDSVFTNAEQTHKLPTNQSEQHISTVAKQNETVKRSLINNDGTAIYLDPSYSPEERAADLVSRMTLEEKALQLNSSQAPAIPRLDVEAYGWWNEAAHGVAREQYNHDANPYILINTTSYPVDLSMGATWNQDLMYEEAVLISDEARDIFRDNKLDLNFYSPTINLSRDPRWGRNDEAFSEDPFLTAAMASQFVNGMEGKDMNGELLPESDGYLKVSTTIKHYAANNSEFDRLTGTSNMDDRTLREYYTAPFRAVIEASDPSSIMTAYNSVNELPSSANVYLLDTLARETFGFGGFFTSDCDALAIMETRQEWFPPGETRPVNELERHAYALTAGVDLNCNKGYHDEYSYGNTLPEAIASNIGTFTGVLNENDVDTAVLRLMTTRIRMGEFDDDAAVPWVTQARERLAPGTWVNSDENNAVTQTPERLAMARRAAGESIVLLKNNYVTRKDGRVAKLLPLRVPESGAFRVAVIGYYANLSPVFLGGYPSIQESAGIANEVTGYEGIKKAVQEINPNAEVDHLSGLTSEELDELDEAAIDTAADYDAVIVYVGDDERHSREDVDRESVVLPGVQGALVSRVAEKNPNTIVYMETVGMVDVTAFEPKIGALLWSSQNGQRKGEGLADVLLGVVNPSGHLPFTWYRDDTQLPPITDYTIQPSEESLGRTYMYFEGEKSYPFGHGLSYTNFAVSRMRVDSRRVDANGSFKVTARVTNTGEVAGSEVIQLYVSTPCAPESLRRPQKRLRGFEKVFLKPGESKRVHFNIDVPGLAFFDESLGRRVVDNGFYRIELSKSADDADTEKQARVYVTGKIRPAVSVVTAKPIVSGDDAAGIARRVFFPQNAVIDPQLTVSLNDDRLYGYITRGESRPLPRKLRVRYVSNRPDIVHVESDGTIRTGSKSGVATVVVWARYHNSYASTSFVVYVPADNPDGPELCEFTCSEHCRSIGGTVMPGFCADADLQCCDLRAQQN